MCDGAFVILMFMLLLLLLLVLLVDDDDDDDVVVVVVVVVAVVDTFLYFLRNLFFRYSQSYLLSHYPPKSPFKMTINHLGQSSRFFVDRLVVEFGQQVLATADDILPNATMLMGHAL